MLPVEHPDLRHSEGDPGAEPDEHLDEQTKAVIGAVNADLSGRLGPYYARKGRIAGGHETHSGSCSGHAGA